MVKVYYIQVQVHNNKVCIINPRHMREGCSSRSVCECVCLLSGYVENKLLLNFLCHFHCVNFVENAFSKFWKHLLTITAFFASWRALDWWKHETAIVSLPRRLVCRSSDNSYSSTNSSLVTVGINYTFGFVCTRSADLAYSIWCVVLLRNCMQSVS